ncbi:hypothetical protein [Mucilaginibacter sp. FT3.2]|uniref:hypothetical protein n=1 Tax=Mucilaginibacter sp. FT3.2 TaxID=2723090 RepID=UPI0016076107|nr:hypothetical protein [Mucilaginibacter sp. FT3.2]MBB6230130.1 hypothetical protein [Mucilaginibacter sp. FT3.2]
MILTNEELKRIDKRMKTYQIKYGEIYNEILDHIISAIEKKREDGDNSNIELLFQQVVDGQFGGYDGIRKLVSDKEVIYKQSIQKVWWQSVSYYLSLPVFSFVFIALIISAWLPNSEAVKASLLMGCMLLATSAIVYTSFSLKGRVVNSVNGQQPFLRFHLLKRVSASFAFFYCLLFYVPWNIMACLPSMIFTVFMMICLVFNLAAIRFCQQFKTLKPVTR